MNNDTLLIQRSTMPVDRVVAGNDKISIVNPRSITYLKAFGKCEQRNLPNGYTELEYLGCDNTGNAYIDFTSLNTLTTLVSLKACTTLSLSSIISSRNFLFTIGDSQCSHYVEIDTSGKFAVGPGQTVINQVTCIENQKYYLEFIVTPTEVTLFIDGNESVNSSMYQGNTISPRRLFALGSSWKGKNISIYNYSLYDESDNLLVDLVPARRNSDNILGMYDKVSSSFLTNAGTGIFIAGPEVVPTPDKPIDIWCNNGVLKARHQSGLPLGYTLIECIESTGTQYIITNIIANQDTSAEIKYAPNHGYESSAVFGARTSKTSNAFNIWSPSIEKVIAANIGAKGIVTSNIVPQGGTAYVVYLSANRLSVNNDNTNISGVTDFSTPLELRVFDIANGGTVPDTGSSASVNRILSGKIYYFKVWQNDILVLDLIPAKNSSNVVGMYDLVSGQFFTNEGTGDFIAGNEVSDPVKIYTDGTVETILSCGANLFNKSSYEEITAYVNANTGVLTQGTTQKCAVIPCEPNTTYIIANRTISAWGSFTDKTTGSVATAFVITSNVLTTGANDRYLIGLVRTTDGTYDYRDTLNVSVYGGAATTEMLLKVGDYQDVQSIIDGVVTRNVGVKVLDGTENWVALSNSRGYYTGLFNDLIDVPYTTTFGYCTHFDFIRWDYQTTPFDTNKYSYNKDSNRPGCNGNITFRPDLSVYSTVQLWQEYLADQYAAGTPVIVVYPLASPIEKSAESQSITPKSGTNIIEVVESEIDDLDLEIRYRQK